MLRKFLLTGVIIVVAPQTRVQLWFGAIVSLFGLLHHVRVDPFRDPLCNAVQGAAHLQLVFTYLTAILYFVEESSVMTTDGLFEGAMAGPALVAANCAAFVIIFVSSIRGMQRIAMQLNESSLTWADGKPVQLLPPTAGGDGYHLFVSHLWKHAQDTAGTVKSKLAALVPSCRVFLDVDDLEDIGKLEEYVAATDVVLVIVTQEYLSSRNCRRELIAACRAKKPLLLLRETEPDKGATTVAKLKAELEDVERDGGLPVDFHEAAMQLIEMIAAADQAAEVPVVVEWYREGLLKEVAMKAVVANVLQTQAARGARQITNLRDVNIGKTDGNETQVVQQAIERTFRSSDAKRRIASRAPLPPQLGQGEAAAVLPAAAVAVANAGGGGTLVPSSGIISRALVARTSTTAPSRTSLRESLSTSSGVRGGTGTKRRSEARDPAAEGMTIFIEPLFGTVSHLELDIQGATVPTAPAAKLTGVVAGAAAPGAVGRYTMVGPRLKLEMLSHHMTPAVLEDALTQTVRLPTVTGSLSPLAEVNLPLEARAGAGVPPDASYFAFLYPADQDGDLLDDLDLESQSWGFLLLLGGFAYFDAQLHLVGVNAVTFNESPISLAFAGPYGASPAAIASLQGQQRMCRVTLDALLAQGFRSFAWVHPDEAPGGTRLSAEGVAYDFGAFAYKLDAAGKEGRPTSNEVFFALRTEEVPSSERSGALASLAQAGANTLKSVSLKMALDGLRLRVQRSSRAAEMAGMLHMSSRYRELPAACGTISVFEELHARLAELGVLLVDGPNERGYPSVVMLCPGAFEDAKLLGELVFALGGSEDDVDEVIEHLHHSRTTLELVGHGTSAVGPGGRPRRRSHTASGTSGAVGGGLSTRRHDGAAAAPGKPQVDLIFLFSTEREFRWYINTCPAPLADRSRLNFFGPLYAKWPASRTMQQVVAVQVAKQAQAVSKQTTELELLPAGSTRRGSAVGFEASQNVAEVRAAAAAANRTTPSSSGGCGTAAAAAVAVANSDMVGQVNVFGDGKPLLGLHDDPIVDPMLSSDAIRWGDPAELSWRDDVNKLTAATTAAAAVAAADRCAVDLPQAARLPAPGVGAAGAGAGACEAPSGLRAAMAPPATAISLVEAMLDGHDAASPRSPHSPSSSPPLVPHAATNLQMPEMAPVRAADSAPSSKVLTA